MVEKVAAYAEEKGLIAGGDRIIVGLSGGADSVCLLLVLLELRKRYGLELFAVHVHHGLRGAEADRDEAFASALADRLGVPYSCAYRDVGRLAREESLTEEEAGRKARYEAFCQAMEQEGANKIAVAHNRNDCAETVLFHLFRGSGLWGLAGIPPRRGAVIRPLLCVGREEIEEYLRERGQDFCVDRTNGELRYARNWIRQKVLPAARRINPRAVEHIARTADLLREVAGYVDRSAEAALEEAAIREGDRYVVDIGGLLGLDVAIQREAARKILWELAGSGKDMTAEHVESVLGIARGRTGRRACLPHGIECRREYGKLVLERRAGGASRVGIAGIGAAGDYAYDLAPGGSYVIPEAGVEIELSLAAWAGDGKEIPQNTCTKWLDYDKIERSIQIRNRRKGDYFQIGKDGGRKKLKERFIDRKVPSKLRDRIPLLADGSHVIWILGDRISERYKVTEGTARVLKVTARKIQGALGDVEGGKSDGGQDSRDDTGGRGQ